MIKGEIFMKRIPVIAANWKMNLLKDEAISLAQKTVESVKDVKDKEVILFPSFLQIESVKRVIDNSPIGLGGQNLWYQDPGAYTGEVAAVMLCDSGCSHVLIGHSERRHYFKEDYDTVNLKVLKAIATELKVMLCVGESLEERESGITEMVVVDQIESAFQKVKKEDLQNMTIAYEPIWAIGTGKTATPEDAAHVHQIIRKTIRRLFDEQTGSAMRILYGGSVKPDNIKELMQQEDIDGALVGGASLKAESFSKLIHY